MSASQRGRLLIVEDDPAGRDLLIELLEPEQYAIETAANADEAWNRLTCDPAQFDVILLDWLLPGRSGLELLQQIKRDARLRTIPVVFQTALADREAMVRGIAAGAYYYVTKPLDPEVLISIVHTAIEDHGRYLTLQEALRRDVDAVATLQRASFRFQTLDQAGALASLLSQASPDPERTVIGLGELLINAVEHGNLGISYQEKSHCLAGESWAAEVARRLELPGCRDRFVEVEFQRTAPGIEITITDQGPGFDWRRYLTVTPERVFDSHGRGIAMANLMSFSRLDYHPPGNRVTAFVAIEGPGLLS